MEQVTASALQEIADELRAMARRERALGHALPERDDEYTRIARVAHFAASAAFSRAVDVVTGYGEPTEKTEPTEV